MFSVLFVLFGQFSASRLQIQVRSDRQAGVDPEGLSAKPGLLLQASPSPLWHLVGLLLLTPGVAGRGRAQGQRGATLSSTAHAQA